MIQLLVFMLQGSKGPDFNGSCSWRAPIARRADRTGKKALAKVISWLLPEHDEGYSENGQVRYSNVDTNI